MALILCIAGMVAIYRFLTWLCAPVPFHQLGRFVDNDTAGALYAHRRDALGHGTGRNVREVPRV